MGGGSSRELAVSEDMQKYFLNLQEEIDNCYDLAGQARKKGLDPELEVEIPQATDLAARVEELVGPKGIADEIRKATKKIGNRELVSLEISKKIVKDKKYSFKNPGEAIDQAVRTGLAILTEGVLVAPLEGIADVKLGKNNDGTEFVDLYFSGPIRSAGGTGQAMSVLIADVVRRELKIDKFKPTTGEIERLKEEIPLYKRAQHLQYTPNVGEIDRIVKNCPICINGEGTEDVEVTGYRDLPRVDTNRLRGGACLVIAEGLCLKAPKLLKHVKKLKLRGWGFLDVFVNKGKKEESEEEKKSTPEITPSKKYIGEVIAGRPVFSHPSRKGGFRLRYGRSRTAGLASTSINPVSMFLLDEFIAVGTQLKMERPGKATIGTACNEIEGPVVLLNNGDLVELKSVQQIDKCRIKEIIDVGEILIPFGEFAENNSLLPDASYSYEWWIQELQKKLGVKTEEYDFEHVIKADKETQVKINKKFDSEVDLKEPSWVDAYKISETYDVAIHPFYNLFWHDMSIQELIFLSDFISKNGRIVDEKLVISDDEKIKDILVELCALHKKKNDELIVGRHSTSLIRGCGLDKKDGEVVETERKKLLEKIEPDENILDLVSKLSGFKVKARSPYRIGTRMGRPEKAAERKMRPPPHVLFPLGHSGGNQRLINKAMQKPSIEFEAGVRTCPKCGKKTYKMFCDCGNHTIVNENNRIERITISLSDEIRKVKKNIKERVLPDTIKGVIGTLSAHKTPEMLEKGILRAKHDVSVFKDGTIRFDMTDAPLTHFRPREIDVSVKRLKKMGYTIDIFGNPLKEEDQLCELKVQDLIISKSCAEYFFKVAKFVDDLLVKFYGLKRFYRIKKFEDLTGHLVVGLAPHTSAGAVGRIIGFTEAQVCFAHPHYHAAKRRNCDGDEDGLMLLMDALLNFSHAYIPDKRGGRMDLPLIVTTRLDPSEVDKEAHNVDTLCRYPLDFYKSTLRHAHPKDVEKMMGLVSSRLGTDGQYEGFGFTHDTLDISEGPKVSRYKSLGSMMEKMEAQLSLAALIRAVDSADVAYKVIERHFLPDIIGNFRAFSKQSVRCAKCNINYRRIPLNGVCTKCGGNLTLTVHEKSVRKYLDISKDVAKRYNIPAYANQRIRLVEKSIDSLFMSDKVKTTKLDDFF